MPNYINIGKLAAAFGVKGEMVLSHSLGKKTSLTGLDSFFLEDAPGSFLPYFPRDMRARSENEILLHIDGVDTREKALALIRQQVWITEEDFSKFASGTAPISLLGYTVVDNGKEIGQVLEVIEQPHQLMCRIIYGGKHDILIPVNEQSLQTIDRKKKKLMLDLPEGLVESQI